MAYTRREVTDGVTVMNKALYDNLQDGIEELLIAGQQLQGDVNEVRQSLRNISNITLNEVIEATVE